MFAAMYYLLVIVDQPTRNIADLEITVYDKSVLRFSRFFINPHPVIRFRELFLCHSACLRFKMWVFSFSRGLSPHDERLCLPESDYLPPRPLKLIMLLPLSHRSPMYFSVITSTCPVYPLCAHTKLKAHLCFCLNFFHEILGIYEGHHNCCQKIFWNRSHSRERGWHYLFGSDQPAPQISSRPLSPANLTGTIPPWR